MQTSNPIINKYLNVNGQYSGFKSDERKEEIKSQRVIVQHYPVNVEKVNRGNKIPNYNFRIGNLKLGTSKF